MESCADLISQLYDKNHRCAYRALQALEQKSDQSDEVSQYMGTFLSMLDEPSSYLRTRGLRLLFANAKWDHDFLIVQHLSAILAHMEDEKPITSRTCIQGLPTLVKALPECALPVLDALNHTSRIYDTSMQSLIYKDRKKAIRLIEQMIQEDKKEGKK